MPFLDRDEGVERDEETDLRRVITIQLDVRGIIRNGQIRWAITASSVIRSMAFGNTESRV